MDYLSLSLTMIFVLIALFLSKSFKAGGRKRHDHRHHPGRGAAAYHRLCFVADFSRRPPCFYPADGAVNARGGGAKCHQAKEKYNRFVLEGVCRVSNRRNGDAGNSAVSSYHSAYGTICHSDQRDGHRKFDGALKFVSKPTNSEVGVRKEEIQLILSLGGTPKQSIQRILTSAMKMSMIPTLESQKTLGLVQLPGMMTGQILAKRGPDSGSTLSTLNRVYNDGLSRADLCNLKRADIPIIIHRSSAAEAE